jgi:hypothetical protein
MKIKIAAVAGLFALALGNAQAMLVDVVGTNYNFDSTTGLAWMDISVTTNVSFNSMMNGWGGLITSGWRYASRDELNAMLSSNLQSLVTAAPVNATGQLYNGFDSATNYFAYPQPDSNGDMRRLINVLGGETLPAIQSTIGIIGSPAPCTGGCSAHALLQLTNDTSFTGGATVTGGGAMDDYGHYYIGSFLVSSQVAAVPESETYAMMLAGLGLIGGIARRRKQQQASA